MPLRDDLLNPIAGGNPSGPNLRYDPVVDKIKDARREDIDAPQGAWKSTVKVADLPLVIKLAGETIAKRSKDLQIAVWLVDAHVRREGFAILPGCFDFLRELITKFWDTLYPEIEDGDVEMRAAPLDWLGSKLEEPIRMLPITSNGVSWVRYKESRTVGYEGDANTSDKKKIRAQQVEEGKLTGEEFDEAVNASPKPFCEALVATLEQSVESLEALTSLLDEKFGDVSPSFIKVRTAIEEILKLEQGFVNKKGGPTVTAPPPPPEPVVVPSPQPASVAAAAAAPAPAPVAAAPPPPPPPAPAAPAPVVYAAASSEPADADDAARRIAHIARWMRSKDVYDISPYLILRGLRWGEIRYNGPEIDQSMLAGPDSDLRKNLEAAFESQDWDSVLQLTESAMENTCGRGWLDLQRYTVRALEGKGKWFAFVADAVRTGVRGLIQDLPGLLDLNLRDGSPTADAETRTWIEQEVMAGAVIAPRPAAPAEAQPAVEEAKPEPEPQTELQPAAAEVKLPAIDLMIRPPQVEADPLTQEEESTDFGQAIEAAREGRMGEALDLIRRKLATEHSGRGRFKRRVQLAHLLMAAKRDKVAEPILRDLAAEIEQRRLEDWEDGEAVAYPLSLLVRCAAQSGDQRKAIYERICRLDPVRALELSE
jgi:type VI secretion system protein ImpA